MPSIIGADRLIQLWDVDDLLSTCACRMKPHRALVSYSGRVKL